MTVKELIIALQFMPEDSEVVIVHNDWSILKVEFNEKNSKVRIR